MRVDPQLPHERLVDPQSRGPVWRRICPNELGDVDEGVLRPEVDRVEERVGEEERRGVEDPSVVVSDVALERQQVEETVVVGVRRPIGGCGMVEVVATVGQERARRHLNAIEVAIPGGRVVEPRFPGMHDGSESSARRVAGFGEMAVLCGELRVEVA